MIIEGKVIAFQQIPGNTKRGAAYLYALTDEKLKRKRRSKGRFKELGEELPFHNQIYWKTMEERNKEMGELMGKKVRITIEAIE